MPRLSTIVAQTPSGLAWCSRMVTPTPSTSLIILRLLPKLLPLGVVVVVGPPKRASPLERRTSRCKALPSVLWEWSFVTPFLSGCPLHTLFSNPTLVYQLGESPNLHWSHWTENITPESSFILNTLPFLIFHRSPLTHTRESEQLLKLVSILRYGHSTLLQLQQFKLLGRPSRSRKVLLIELLLEDIPGDIVITLLQKTSDTLPPMRRFTDKHIGSKLDTLSFRHHLRLQRSLYSLKPCISLSRTSSSLELRWINLQKVCQCHRALNSTSIITMVVHLLTKSLSSGLHSSSHVLQRSHKVHRVIRVILRRTSIRTTSHTTSTASTRRHLVPIHTKQSILSWSVSISEV